MTIPVSALEHDAYTVPLIVTYANPETGAMIDGGGNEALGTSMSQSVMQADALVEYDGENYYVSLGIGLISNISSVDILLQTAPGQDEYQSVEITETGRVEKDGDMCVHYRFVMPDVNLLISPQLFVDPMGREVQFFIRLDMDKAERGTSNYFSEMIKEEPMEETVSSIIEPTTEPTIELAVESVTEEMPESTVTSSVNDNQEIRNMLLMVGVIVIGLVVAIVIRIKKHEN